MNDKTKEMMITIVECLSICMEELTSGYIDIEEATTQMVKIDSLLSELKGDKEDA